jgi:hypothetical protein
MNKFQSEYHENADDLIHAMRLAWDNTKDRINRLKIVRAFTNMMNTMTPEEAEQLGRTEITNYGLTHRDMLQQESQFTSMVTVTNALLDLVVDTDNAEQDSVTGMRISEAINRHAIHFKGKFANFWRKAAGEIVIAGGVPATQNELYGWLPRVRPDMFFPQETSLDADEITFAFDPKELSISDLKNLSKAVAEGKDSRYIDKENIDKLIEKIEEQIKDDSKVYSNYGEIQQSSRSGGKNQKSITVSAYWYYEVKYEENGNRYVSATLFIDGVQGIDFSRDPRNDKDSSGSAKIIAYIDRAFENASDWIHMVCVDSEIGGVKNMDTLRGVAEMTYPASLEMAELLNLMMEGDKIRARPKFKVLDGGDLDALQKWNAVQELYMPHWLEEAPFKGNSNSLMTPMSMLSQTAASMTGGAMSNGPQGGELRQQAMERQQNSAMLQTNRVSEAYNHMESILETVVWRILAGPVKPGTEGYHEIMRIRETLDRYQIPYKQLASRKHGQFQYIRVKVRRSIGNGDRVQQLETAKRIVEIYSPHLPPASRALALRRAIELEVQDPDLAETLVKVPKAIINAQKITAENEHDTIRRRAPLGQVLPIADDDVDQDHIPIHLIDMQAHIATHQHRPWDMLDVLVFAGETEHTGMHITRLMENPATHPEGAQFIQDYQNITQAAQAIIQEVEEQQGQQQQQGIDPTKSAELQLKAEKLRLEAMKIGMAAKDKEDLRDNRNQKENLAKRSQFINEVNEDRRLKIEQQRLAVQAKAQKEKPKTTPKKAK